MSKQEDAEANPELQVDATPSDDAAFPDTGASAEPAPGVAVVPVDPAPQEAELEPESEREPKPEPEPEPEPEPLSPEAERRAEVAEAFQRRRVELTDQEIDDLATYLGLIEHWNARINLTAIRDRPTAISRHLVEPVMIRYNLAGAGPVLVDAGSGVGVPGIPLAITDRDRDVVLVEANGKKAAFLHEVVDTLRLQRVRVVEARIEEAVASGELEGPIHVLAARGWTSGWGELLGLMAPLMAPGGRAMLLTGGETERALRRHLARGVQQAPTSVPEWRAAALAGWTLRRARPLPHLKRGFLVTLELPMP